MKIEFINHASVIVDSAGFRLITDPWLDGKVVDNTWALHSPSPAVDFSKVDAIWISHEHADHFHFPTLKKIPPKERERIQLLFQKHGSTRMLKAIQALGFKNVIELPLMRWVKLRPDFEVFCISVGSLDSSLAIRTEGRTILNINDCMINEKTLMHLKSRLGPVEILLMQFSIAIWPGNHSDELGEGARKIHELKRAVEITQPRLTIPFASFAYFCNRENARMNAWANSPAKIASLGIPGLNFMYPGDVWDSNEDKFDSARAVELYERDRANAPIDPTPPALSPDKIREAAQTFLKDFHALVPFFLRRKVEPFQIHLTDLNRILTLDVRKHAWDLSETATEEQAQRARFSMCSQAAWHMMSFDWGPNNLESSGTFLDREFLQKGQNLAFRYRTQFGTKIFEVKSISDAFRCFVFFWNKRVEIWHRLTTRTSHVFTETETPALGAPAPKTP